MQVRVYLPTGPTMHYTDEAIADLREREVGTELPIRAENQGPALGYGKVGAVDFDERGPYMELEIDGDLAAKMTGGLDTIVGVAGFSIRGEGS